MLLILIILSNKGMLDETQADGFWIPRSQLRQSTVTATDSNMLSN